MLLWAVDAGGTKTCGVLADERGQVLTAQMGGPCNLSMLGAAGCRDVLAGLLATTCRAAGVDAAGIDCAFFALGGLDTDADRAALQDIVAHLFQGTGTRWRVENDVLAALFSGTLGEPGVVLLAGTGSMAMGLDAAGHLFRCGGWGHWISGDPGSAFDVGHRLLVHVVKNHDTGTGPDGLTSLAMVECGIASPPGIVDWVEDHENPPTRIAQLARVVDKASQAGDAPAAAILRAAAGALVEHLAILLPRLTLAAPPVPVVLAGGMFNSPVYREAVQTALAAANGRWRPVLPSMPPVGGAYIGALFLAGQMVRPAVVERFAAEVAAPPSPAAGRQPV